MVETAGAGELAAQGGAGGHGAARRPGRQAAVAETHGDVVGGNRRGSGEPSAQPERGGRARRRDGRGEREGEGGSSRWGSRD